MRCDRQSFMLSPFAADLDDGRLRRFLVFFRWQLA